MARACVAAWTDVSATGGFVLRKNPFCLATKCQRSGSAGRALEFMPIHCSLQLLRCYCFRREAFIRLEGLRTEVSTEFAQLGSLGDVVIVGSLGIFALHPDHLVDRLRTNHLLEGLGAVLN